MNIKVPLPCSIWYLVINFTFWPQWKFVAFNVKTKHMDIIWTEFHFFGTGDWHWYISCPIEIFVSHVQWKSLFLLSNGKLCFYLTNGYLCIILLSNGNLCFFWPMEICVTPVKWKPSFFPVQWNYCFSCHRLLLVLTLRLSAAVLMLLTRPAPRPVCRFLISECFSTRSARWPSLASMDKNVQINWS